MDNILPFCRCRQHIPKMVAQHLRTKLQSFTSRKTVGFALTTTSTSTRMRIDFLKDIAILFCCMLQGVSLILFPRAGALLLRKPARDGTWMTATMHREKIKETPYKCLHLWFRICHEYVSGYRAARFLFYLEFPTGKDSTQVGAWVMKTRRKISDKFPVLKNFVLLETVIKRATVK